MATEIIRFFQPFPSICGLDVAAEKNVPKNKNPPAKPGVFHMRAKPYVTSHASCGVGTV